MYLVKSISFWTEIIPNACQVIINFTLIFYSTYFDEIFILDFCFVTEPRKVTIISDSIAKYPMSLT